MHCFFLIDHTGSMASMKDAVRSGFDHFVAKQKAQEGSMLMTLAQFNSEKPFELLFSGVDVRKVEPLVHFQPFGQTPLYDALHGLIEHASRIESSSESEVVVAVFTDGAENDSRKHTRAEVFKLIEERRKMGWTFVFLGANQDSFGTSRGMSVAAGATSNFVADARGMKNAWRDFEGSTLRYRGRMRSGKAPTHEDRANYLAGFDAAERDYQQRGKGAASGNGHRDSGGDGRRAGAGGGGGRRRGLKAMKGRQMARLD